MPGVLRDGMHLKSMPVAALFWLLLAAAPVRSGKETIGIAAQRVTPSRVELVNEDYQIAPGDWQWVEVNLKQRAGAILANYQVLSGPPSVRLVLMHRHDLDNMPLGALGQTQAAGSGSFIHRVREVGNYALVVENQSATAPSIVHLNVWIDFARPGRTVETLSPQRQLTVILVSFAAFFGIVAWSARRLLKAVKRTG